MDLNGIQPRISDKPIVFPDDVFNEYGCEDPRATILEGRPVVTYTAVSRFGTTIWFARLGNDYSFQDKTILLGPDHKHSALFPEKIGNYYYMLSRPLSRTYIRSSGAWLFRSTDLISWSMPFPILMPRPNMWDSIRVGPSASPLLTPHGWLFLYYGVDNEDSYHVGAALLDKIDPYKVIARSNIPILSPLLDWERMGRRADTVFSCGYEVLNNKEDTIRIYYGAADTYIGSAEISVSFLLNLMLQK